MRVVSCRGVRERGVNIRAIASRSSVSTGTRLRHCLRHTRGPMRLWFANAPSDAATCETPRTCRALRVSWSCAINFQARLEPEREPAPIDPTEWPKPGLSGLEMRSNCGCAGTKCRCCHAVTVRNHRRAEHSPRSNQTTATLFDEGANDKTGNNNEETFARRGRCHRVRCSSARGRSARAHLTRLRPIRRRKWSITGPASISAATSAARSRAETAWREAAAGSWAAFRAAPTISSRNNWVIGAEAQYDWLSNNNNGGVTVPGRHDGDREQRPARFGDRPVGLCLGSDAALRQGRLCLARQQNIGVTLAGVPQAFTTDGGHKDGYTVGAGLEYMFAPNWSAKLEYQYYNFGSTTFTGGPAGDRRRPVPRRRAHNQGRPELPLRLGRPGRHPVLSALLSLSIAKGRLRAGLFF